MEREKARARSFSWCQRNNLILNEWIYSSRKANSWRKTLSPSTYYYCCISIPLSNLNPWDLSSLLLLSLRVSLFFFCSFFIFPWNITLSQSWLLQANSNPLIFTGQDLTLFIIIFSLLHSCISRLWISSFVLSMWMHRLACSRCESSVTMPLLPLIWSEMCCCRLLSVRFWS